MLFSVFDEENIQPGMFQGPAHPLAMSSETYLDRARAFLSGDHESINTVSPFLMNWGFQVFRYYYTKYSQDGHSENLEAVKDLQRTMEVLEGRWKAAGNVFSFGNVYVRLIIANIGIYMILLNENQI